MFQAITIPNWVNMPYHNNILRRASLAARIICLLLLVIAAMPQSALADTEIIPLPVYATSRNGGNDYGFMPVFMRKDEGEYVYAIIAPSVIYNDQTGTNITFRYLGYPTVDKNFRVFVNQSIGVDRETTVEYWDNKFMDGRFRLFARGTVFRDSTYRFFGFGENSREADETNYSNLEVSPEYRLGYYLPHNLVASFGQKFRRVDIRRGKLTKLPYLQSRFPDIDGIKGGTTLANRVTLTYDDRDDEVYPTSGQLANVYGEVSHDFTGGRTYTRVGADARKFISFSDGRYTTVIKGAFELTGGSHIPFFERGDIGGENSLRGLGTYRFIDDGYVVINLEERIRLFRLHIYGVWSDWEVAPFVDMGRVYSSFRKQPIEGYRINPGVGFRAIVKPNVVGRVDFGYGQEGLNAFVGLDFPF
ncbi:MAG: BamA/TamA family outer membrane protein [Nitrospirae bacterium]|nr:BamA/TamA family outer membrane protein [Nitrospirota bacterium]